MVGFTHEFLMLDMHSWRVGGMEVSSGELPQM